MTADEIRAAITSDPAILALMPDTAAVASALSVGRTTLVEKLITERRIIGTLGLVDGHAFLSGLEQFGDALLPDDHPLKAHQPGLGRVLEWLKSDGGLDVGSPLAQQMLTVLAQLGVVSADSAAIVKALARVPDPLPEIDVRRAVFADDGTPLV